MGRCTLIRLFVTEGDKLIPSPFGVPYVLSGFKITVPPNHDKRGRVFTSIHTRSGYSMSESYFNMVILKYHVFNKLHLVFESSKDYTN